MPNKKQEQKGSALKVNAVGFSFCASLTGEELQ